ncbi:MAG TPA: alpha/beta hydrolase [Gammaproteobacteria bacterium]
MHTDELPDRAEPSPGTTRADGPLQLQTPWLRIAALRWGSGGPQRLLALHGWLDNAASFTALAPLLDGCEVVALDLPGHGHSEHRPPGVPYHFVDFVPDVLAAADALGWQRFALLGHSLGAGIASYVAVVAPQRVCALALVEGLGPHSGEPQEEPGRLATALRQMARLPWREPPLHADHASAIAARQRADGLGAAAARVLVERALHAVDGGWTWRSDPRLLFRSPAYQTEAQVLAFLSRIRCPALLVTGADSAFRARAGLAARMQQVAGLQHLVLPGGHHLHLENAAALAAPLQRFLAARDAEPA